MFDICSWLPVTWTCVPAKGIKSGSSFSTYPLKVPVKALACALPALAGYSQDETLMLPSVRASEYVVADPFWLATALTPSWLNAAS